MIDWESNLMSLERHRCQGWMFQSALGDQAGVKPARPPSDPDRMTSSRGKKTPGFPNT